jgi:flagellar motor switch protein FliM
MPAARVMTDSSRNQMMELFTSTTAERVAALRAATESMAADCSALLQGASGSQLQLTVSAVENATAGKVIAGIAGTGVCNVLRAAAQDMNVLVSADQTAVWAIIEALLGGDGSEPPHVAERPLTRIETRLSGLLFEALAKALEDQFSSSAPMNFVVQSATDRLDGDVLGRPNDAVAIVKLRLDAAEHGGEILLAFPQSAVRSIRQSPARGAREAGKPDSLWLRRMQSEVDRASVTLSGVLDATMSELGDISSFSVGQVIELKATMQSRVWFECNGERLVWCYLGKSNGVYAMRVDDHVDPEQEFMDEILSG